MTAPKFSEMLLQVNYAYFYVLLYLIILDGLQPDSNHSRRKKIKDTYGKNTSKV